MSYSINFSPLAERKRVRLRDRYPTTSRMTRLRMRKQPGFPKGVDILGTTYFYEDELEQFELRDKAEDAAEVNN